MKTKIIRGILTVTKVIPVQAILLRAELLQAQIVSKETHMTSLQR